MFGFDVILEGSGLAKCFIAVRTLIRPLTQMNSFNVSLEGTVLIELLITLLTTERLLLGVDSDVHLEVGRSE